MERLACVDVPALPLQLLLRANPAWREHPVVVVEEDRPQGKILWVNERARRHRILPGMRYAAALSLARELRASMVGTSEIQEGVTALLDHLRHFSPEVEAACDEPGIFWVNASGLGRIYPSLEQWGWELSSALQERGFVSSVAVGFSRFGAYATARAGRGVRVFDTADDEDRFVAMVPLARLDLAPKARDALDRLGIRKVGELLRLPASGIRKRFGDAAWELHRRAHGEREIPVRADMPEEPIAAKLELDFPDPNVERLLFRIKNLLHPLLTTLAEDARALTRLHLRMGFDDPPPSFVQPSSSYFRGSGSDVSEHDPGAHIIRPAEPTLDAVQLLDLVRLRLEAMELPAGVVSVELLAEGIEASREQLRLFVDNPKRDLDAAHRALARLRAELGDDAVVIARPREGHLPEARFTWAPLDKLRLPRPRDVTVRPLVRRLLLSPRPLPPRPRHERDDGWHVRGMEHGPILRLIGPYILSGAWWHTEIHRAYHFAETQRGDLLWVYYDRRRRRWVQQGRIE